MPDVAARRPHAARRATVVLLSLTLALSALGLAPAAAQVAEPFATLAPGTLQGSTMVDPVTGQLTVAMPAGDPSDVTISRDLADPECMEITSAVLLYGGVPVAFSPVSEGSTVHSGTIPAEMIVGNPGGTVVIEVTCAGAPTQVVVVGTIVLYDPSGIVSDAETGEPVVGAEVFLHRVPGALPDIADEEGVLVEERDCRTVDTREGDDWTGEPDADADLGGLVNPASPEISPNVNPFVTNEIGYYGWDVAEGCWYVVVEAEGYETRVSPVVGVPPEVLDLDLELTPDATAPSWPEDAELDVSEVTETSVQLTWPEASDDSGVTGYHVYRGGTFLADIEGSPLPTTYTATGLQPATAYTFRVEAHDAFGNESEDGPSATVTTLTPPDTTPPSWPAGAELDANDVTETSVQLSWPEATDDTDVTGYHVYRNATFVADVHGSPLPTTYTATGLLPGTSYTFSVEAHDAEGNETGDGPSVTVTTLADEPGGDEACPEGEVELAPFTDRLSIPDVHRPNVDCAFWREVVTGFDDNTYRPTVQVRRDQMASFIARALDAAGVALPAPADARFTDVGAGSTHDDNIHRLAAAEIVQGGPGGLPEAAYGPAMLVRRDQMASFLLRAVEYATGEDLSSQEAAFSDVSPTNAHFANVNGAAEVGLAQGVGGGLYRPDAGVRRDQMGSFVVRLLARLLEGTATAG